jgi:hypothetical protein
MWQLVIMTFSAGVASTLYALLRASKAEKARIIAEARAETSEGNAKRWKTELDEQAETYKDQLARREAEIATLREQRKQAIDALENHTSPGSLRSALRLSLGVSPDSRPKP